MSETATIEKLVEMTKESNEAFHDFKKDNDELLEKKANQEAFAELEEKTDKQLEAITKTMEEIQKHDAEKDGKIKADGVIPTNTTGGLIGYGHPTGATGVRQAVDVVHQLSGKAGDCQVKIHPGRPFGMMSSMGGNDKTVVAMVFRKTD